MGVHEEKYFSFVAVPQCALIRCERRRARLAHCPEGREPMSIDLITAKLNGLQSEARISSFL